AQGLRFVVISGDHPETVKATVDRLRLPLAGDHVVTGDELEAAADREAVILRTGGVGRGAPRPKVEIVTPLHRPGRHGRMGGDGINDVLPIKQADLGIAMGAGSGAARTVAAIVL